MGFRAYEHRKEGLIFELYWEQKMRVSQKWLNLIKLPLSLHDRGCGDKSFLSWENGETRPGNFAKRHFLSRFTMSVALRKMEGNFWISCPRLTSF